MIRYAHVKLKTIPTLCAGEQYNKAFTGTQISKYLVQKWSLESRKQLRLSLIVIFSLLLLFFIKCNKLWPNSSNDGHWLYVSILLIASFNGGALLFVWQCLYVPAAHSLLYARYIVPVCGSEMQWKGPKVQNCNHRKPILLRLLLVPNLFIIICDTDDLSLNIIPQTENAKNMVSTQQRVTSTSFDYQACTISLQLK